MMETKEPANASVQIVRTEDKLYVVHVHYLTPEGKAVYGSSTPVERSKVRSQVNLILAFLRDHKSGYTPPEK